MTQHQDISRGPILPPKQTLNWRALGMALVAHGLLVLALVLNLDWKTEAQGPMQIELWAEGNSPANPPPQASKPVPQPEAKPEPEPEAEVPPPPPPPPPPQQQPLGMGLDPATALPTTDTIQAVRNKNVFFCLQMLESFDDSSFFATSLSLLSLPLLHTTATLSSSSRTTTASSAPCSTCVTWATA